MVRLNLPASQYFDLDQHWIPDAIFEFNVSGTLERSEDTNDTRFYSDLMPESKPVTLSTTRKFSSVTNLKTFVASIEQALLDVESVTYYGLTRSFSGAVLNWKFGSYGMTSLEATILLYPTSEWSE